MGNNDSEIVIDLGKCIQAVLLRWKTVALAGLMLAAVVLAGTSFLVPPEYESGVMFYVCSAAGEELSSENLSIARKLVESCMVVLNTRQTQQGILDHTGMDISCQELEKRISAEAMGQTEFFRVTVTGGDPVEAERTADAIGAVLPGRVSALIEGFSVKVADAAVLPSEPDGPDSLRSALSGFGLGMILSAALIILQTLVKENRRR